MEHNHSHNDLNTYHGEYICPCNHECPKWVNNTIDNPPCKCDALCECINESIECIHIICDCDCGCDEYPSCECVYDGCDECTCTMNAIICAIAYVGYDVVYNEWMVTHNA